MKETEAKEACLERDLQEIKQKLRQHHAAADIARKKEAAQTEENEKKEVMQQQFNDVQNIEERIEAMSFTESNKKKEIVVKRNVLTKQQTIKYKLKQKGYTEAFEAINFGPNNNQYAVAAVAAENIIDRKRIMLQVGPGLGKSRIWAMLVCMLSGSKFEKFRVLFTDKVL